MLPNYSAVKIDAVKSVPYWVAATECVHVHIICTFIDWVAWNYLYWACKCKSTPGRKSNCNNARILKQYDIFWTKERLYNLRAVRREVHHLRASLFVDISDTDICFVLNEEFGWRGKELRVQIVGLPFGKPSQHSRNKNICDMSRFWGISNTLLGLSPLQLHVR